MRSFFKDRTIQSSGTKCILTWNISFGRPKKTNSSVLKKSGSNSRKKTLLPLMLHTVINSRTLVSSMTWPRTLLKWRERWDGALIKKWFQDIWSPFSKKTTTPTPRTNSWLMPILNSIRSRRSYRKIQDCWEKTLNWASTIFVLSTWSSRRNCSKDQVTSLIQLPQLDFIITISKHRSGATNKSLHSRTRYLARNSMILKMRVKIVNRIG